MADRVPFGRYGGIRHWEEQGKDSDRTSETAQNELDGQSVCGNIINIIIIIKRVTFRKFII